MKAMLRPGQTISNEVACMKIAKKLSILIDISQKMALKGQTGK